MIAYDMFEDTDRPINALIAKVSAGEPLEMSDEVTPIDLNYLLSRGSQSSLLIRVEGDSMEDVPIASGDWVMLDCSREPKPNDIVVAKLNGGYTIKRHKLNDRNGRTGLYLVPANGSYPIREITELDDYRILGVVTYVIHRTV